MNSKFLSSALVTLCLVNFGCVSPAFAEKPPATLTPIVEEKPVYEVPYETLRAIETYLSQSAILYSVKCEEKKENWYCSANPILQEMQKTIKVKGAADANKPSKDKK